MHDGPAWHRRSRCIAIRSVDTHTRTRTAQRQRQQHRTAEQTSAGGAESANAKGARGTPQCFTVLNGTEQAPSIRGSAHPRHRRRRCPARTPRTRAEDQEAARSPMPSTAAHDPMSKYSEYHIHPRVLRVPPTYTPCALSTTNTSTPLDYSKDSSPAPLPTMDARRRGTS